jgi:ornithine cyclodeaminase
MLKFIDIPGLIHLLQQMGYSAINKKLISYLRHDFSRWDDFHKIPRPAAHSPEGVIELMPIWDEQYYAYKYVNGHPNNTKLGKLTVAATGQLSDIKTGYPLLLTEMTILTAIRTAAVAALASSLLARKDSSTLALIGTGAQSEFQVMAHLDVLPIKTVKYYDTHPAAMEKFAHNLRHLPIELIACESIDAALVDADIVNTLTAAKAEQQVLSASQIQPGVHINALGGDCPGKTELDKAILEKAKVVIEYFEQSYVEGEIQQLEVEQAKAMVHAELADIVSGKKTGREDDNEITVFDGVGIAIEDFSTLRMLYDITQEEDYGTEIDLIPAVSDPRDLFSMLELDYEK